MPILSIAGIGRAPHYSLLRQLLVALPVSFSLPTSHEKRTIDIIKPAFSHIEMSYSAITLTSAFRFVPAAASDISPQK